MSTSLKVGNIDIQEKFLVLHREKKEKQQKVVIYLD